MDRRHVLDRKLILRLHTLRTAVMLFACLVATMTFGQQPTSTSRSDRELRIVAFGDSTTVGYSVNEGYPTKLARRLADLGIPAAIINAGVNGDTTSGGRKRLADDVFLHQPDLVIIQFGLNDQTIRLYETPETTKTYVTLEEFTENLRYFTRTLRAAGCHVILMTPNPMAWTDTLEFHYPAGPYLDGPRGGNKLLRRYADEVRYVAAEEGVDLIDVLNRFDEFEKQPGQRLAELFLDDGVHPNEAGYTLIAKDIASTIAVRPSARNKTVTCCNISTHDCLTYSVSDEGHLFQLSHSLQAQSRRTRTWRPSSDHSTLPTCRSR